MCRSPALIKPLEAANPAIPDPDLSESATDARFQHETLAAGCICADLRPETQFANHCVPLTGRCSCASSSPGWAEHQHTAVQWRRRQLCEQ